MSGDGTTCLAPDPIPTCQICRNAPAEVDGKTRSGQWGYMCSPCHDAMGYGLGIGRGQRFISLAEWEAREKDRRDREHLALIARIERAAAEALAEHTRLLGRADAQLAEWEARR